MYQTLIVISFITFVFLYFFIITTEKEEFTNADKKPPSKHKKPKCVCVYDVDGTLTNLSNLSSKDSAIDARASVESCINAGCAIGLVATNKFCTDQDPENCKISEYAFGFNIKNPEQVKKASEKLKKPIVTGEDWVVSNVHKGDAMKIFSKKICNPKCGLLIDDNILQGCGNCNTFDKNSYCPAPWGGENDKPNLCNIKKAYKCKFNSVNARDFGNDYTWVPAREINVKKANKTGIISQMGGTGFNWNDGAQLAHADGIIKDYWNSAVQTKAVHTMNKNCKINLKPVNEPILKSKLQKQKRCDHKKNPPNCTTYVDCENYMKTNCGNKVISDYTYSCLENKKNPGTRICKIENR
uniref:Uncharacterized protein n=1 Tax=viral metagenome TaxID=1070528 RepID=A0A6C0B393_9ZZZZ